MIKCVKDFNSNINIKEVVEKLTGININANGGMICPFHGTHDNKKKYNASIREDKNTFSCWTKNCTDGAVRSFTFADKWCREKLGMDNWKEIYKFLDSKFGTSLYKEIKVNIKEVPKKDFTQEFKVNKYCGEVEKEIIINLFDDKIICLQAGTGVGKTTALAEGFENAIRDFKAIGIDKILFTTPRSSIVEEINEDFGYSKFYKNDTVLPSNFKIVATTHKAARLNECLSEQVAMYSDRIEYTDPLKYVLIIDECHLLLTSRGIVGNIKELDKLIENAEYVIFTSANTEHFYKACKELYNIKGYYNVERINKIYNINNLEVVRTNRDREDKRKQLINMIEKEENKVFLVYNNISELREIEQELNSKGIMSKTVYSANKEEEGVIDIYNAIIKESILKCKVTLCTSVVDTGVNIKQKESVTTILVQGNQTVDDITITQTFARVRDEISNNINNKGILILDKIKERKEKHDKISNFDNFSKYYNEISEQVLQQFRLHMLNNYDLESFIEWNLVWELLKDNNMYAPYKSLLKIVSKGDYNEEPNMIVDTVAAYDKARRQHLSDNYYSDEFIKEILKGVNFKTLEFKEINEKVEKKEKVAGSSFQDALISLMEDKEEFKKALEDRYLNVEEEEENFWLEIVKSEFPRKFNELDKRIFAMKKMLLKNKVDYDLITYAQLMYRAYSLPKPKETLLEVRDIEYPLYNTMYLKGDYTGIGDSLYESIRFILDGYCCKGYKVSSKIIENISIELMSKENVAFIDGKWIDRNGKKVRISSKIDTIKSTIESIYNISDKGYLSNIKVVC